MLRRANGKPFIYLFLGERRLSSALFRLVTKVWCVADLCSGFSISRTGLNAKQLSGNQVLKDGVECENKIFNIRLFLFFVFKGECTTVTLLVLMLPDLVKSVYIFLSSPSTLGYQPKYSRQALVEYCESSWFFENDVQFLSI